MKHKIFVVYDSKARAYLPPFFLPEMGQAIRAFGDCANDKSHQFGKHPEDYTLFCSGEFDDKAGSFEHEKTLLVVAHAHELVQREEDPRQTQIPGLSVVKKVANEGGEK